VQILGVRGPKSKIEEQHFVVFVMDGQEMAQFHLKTKKKKQCL